MSRTAVPAAANGFVSRAAVLLVLTYLGFVSLGLPDAAYGVAWPFLSAEFGLPQGAFGLGLASVGVGFLCSSLSAGALLDRFGAGRLLSGSTLVTALGLCGFALAPSWPVFLLFGLLAGLGGGAIDAGLNAYAAGHYSARHMNWLHAAFGFGAALGPLAMTAAVSLQGWRPGYGALAGVMGLLAILFFATRRLWAREPERVDPGDAAEAEAVLPKLPMGRVIAERRVQIRVLCFAIYAGAEVATGQWAFAVLSQAQGLSVQAAGFWTGVFWFALFSGRVLLGFGADRLGARALARGGALASVLGLLLFAFTPGALSLAGLALAGFGMAPVFPMLMHLTPAAMGPSLANHTIGLQVSGAMIGAVGVPALAGWIAQATQIGSVPLFLLCVGGVMLALVAVVTRRV